MMLSGSIILPICSARDWERSGLLGGIPGVVNRGTPTKRQVSKRQVSKRLVSKRPVSKRQVYKNVRVTKRQASNRLVSKRPVF